MRSNPSPLRFVPAAGFAAAFVFIALGALGLTGCTEVVNNYYLDDEKVADDSADQDTASPEDDGVEHIGSPDVDEDTAENQCGFEISENFGNYETTVTTMTYNLVGEPEIQIRQGETANFTFEIAADPCGDTLYDGMYIVVSNDEAADWVTSVDESSVETRLVHITGDNQIDGIEGTNCNSAGYDRQVFYQWQHQPTTSADGYMDEVFVGAGESEQFCFYFAETASIPVGTTFEIYLLDPEWIDLESGADVWDTAYYMRQGGWDDGLVGITVTVVE